MTRHGWLRFARVGWNMSRRPHKFTPWSCGATKWATDLTICLVMRRIATSPDSHDKKQQQAVKIEWRRSSWVIFMLFDYVYKIILHVFTSMIYTKWLFSSKKINYTLQLECVCKSKIFVSHSQITWKLAELEINP